MITEVEVEIRGVAYVETGLSDDVIDRRDRLVLSTVRPHDADMAVVTPGDLNEVVIPRVTQTDKHTQNESGRKTNKQTKNKHPQKR